MCIHLRHKMELAPWGFNAEFVPLKWFILLRRKIYFSCKSGFYINYNEILEMTSFFFKRISEYIGYSCRLIIESLKGRKFESQHVKLGGWLFTFICWYLNFIVQCDQIGRFLHFGQLFKACGNNYIAQIFDILRQVSKSFIFLLDLFLGNFIDIWGLFNGHTAVNPWGWGEAWKPQQQHDERTWKKKKKRFRSELLRRRNVRSLSRERSDRTHVMITITISFSQWMLLLFSLFLEILFPATESGVGVKKP